MRKKTRDAPWTGADEKLVIAAKKPLIAVIIGEVHRLVEGIGKIDFDIA